jgi:predicted XRE-type DNA-binding protein
VHASQGTWNTRSGRHPNKCRHSRKQHHSEREAPADDNITCTTVSDELFEILNIPNAAEERARADLASAISLEIRRRGLTQAQAAKILGVTQPDVSAIMNARIGGFSQERLERLLNALDMDVRIQVGPRPAGKARADTTVQLLESF